MNGKQKRLGNILTNNKAIIVPMDHGLSDGLLNGLVHIEETIQEVTLGGASAVILHKGIIKSLIRVPNTGLILHASAGTSIQLDTNTKVLVASVKEAIRLGADCISLHINVGGSQSEPEMIRKLALISEECDQWEIPLLAMMYPRGNNIKKTLDSKNIELVTRVGVELGADIIKTVYTGEIESFARVVEGCPVPVVVAGGPKLNSNRDVLQMISDVMIAGAIGVALGRNIFQHIHPRLMTKAIESIVRYEWPVDKALELLEPLSDLKPEKATIRIERYGI